MYKVTIRVNFGRNGFIKSTPELQERKGRYWNYEKNRWSFCSDNDDDDDNNDNNNDNSKNKINNNNFVAKSSDASTSTMTKPASGNGNTSAQIMKPEVMAAPQLPPQMSTETVNRLVRQ
jgi:hypothetical protein